MDFDHLDELEEGMDPKAKKRTLKDASSLDDLSQMIGDETIEDEEETFSELGVFDDLFDNVAKPVSYEDEDDLSHLHGDEPDVASSDEVVEEPVDASTEEHVDETPVESTRVETEGNEIKEVTDDGTEGQDRESYSDDQDRESYTTEEPEDLFPSDEPDTKEDGSDVPEETGHKDKAPTPFEWEVKRQSDLAFLKAVTSMEKED